MAIFHLSTKIIRRSDGRSSTGSAAYRSGERIIDQKTGLIFDYTNKKDIDYTEIIYPKNTPKNLIGRSNLWNEVEKVENRKDAQLAREVEIALPIELNKQQKIDLLKDFVNKEFVDFGMIADISIHHETKQNPHAHILLTMRNITSDGFGNKNRSWNDRKLVDKWRESWSKTCNEHLSKNGHSVKIDHRTLADQGIDRMPQKHIGTLAKAIDIKTKGNGDKVTKIINNAKKENFEQMQSEILDIHNISKVSNNAIKLLDASPLEKKILYFLSKKRKEKQIKEVFFRAQNRNLQINNWRMSREHGRKHRLGELRDGRFREGNRANSKTGGTTYRAGVSRSDIGFEQIGSVGRGANVFETRRSTTSTTTNNGLQKLCLVDVASERRPGAMLLSSNSSIYMVERQSKKLFETLRWQKYTDDLNLPDYKDIFAALDRLRKLRPKKNEPKPQNSQIEKNVEVKKKQESKKIRR